MRLSPLPLLVAAVAPAPDAPAHRIASAEQLAALEWVAQAAADLVDHLDEVMSRRGDATWIVTLGAQLDALDGVGRLGGTPPRAVDATTARALWAIADGSKRLHQQLHALLANKRDGKAWTRRLNATINELRAELQVLS